MGMLREVWNEGDPGRRRRGFFRRFKPPKFARRLIGKLTPFARFIPGVGTVMDTVENARSLIPAGDGGFMYGDDDEGDAFDYFDDEGDPGSKPRRGTAKRSGGGGRKRSRGRKRRGHGPGLGNLDLGKLGQAALGAIPVVGGVAQELASQLAPQSAAGGEGIPVIPGVTPIADMGGMLPSLGGGGKRGRHEARPRRMVHRKVDAWTAKATRSMNASNPRALRHALRRVEGFERIVKRMERAYPRLKRVHTHHAPMARHKKGR